MSALSLEAATSSSGQVIRQLNGAQHNFSYTSCYCEENVYLLAPALVRLGLAPSIDYLFAVFISNPLKQMPLWKQRAGLTQDRRRRRRHRLQGSHRSSGSERSKQHSGDSGVGSGVRGDAALGYGDGGEAGGGDEGGADAASTSGGEDGADSSEDWIGGEDDDEGFVVWDYHVVLLQARGPQRPQMPVLVGKVGKVGGEARAEAEAEAEGCSTTVTPRGSVSAAAPSGNAAPVRPQDEQAAAGRREADPEAGGRGPQQAAHGGAGGGVGLTGAAGAGVSAASAAAVAAAAVPPAAAAAATATATAPAGTAATGGASETLVWDLDSLLPFPCSLERYSRRALKSRYQVAPQHRRFFRVVPASSYLHHFASDRSHMRRPGGGWAAEPPPYTPLVAADGTINNIQRYWDMMMDRCPATPAMAVPSAVPYREGSTAVQGQGAVDPEHNDGTARGGVKVGSESESGADAIDGHMGSVWLTMLASAGPYGVVLDEPSFLRAFGVQAT